MSKQTARISYEEFQSNLDSVFERVARERATIVVEKSDGVRVVLRRATSDNARRRAASLAPDEAFRAAFGAWKGIVDGEALKKEIASKRGSRRPAVRL